MADKFDLRQDNYNRVISMEKEFHNRQLKNIRDGITQIRNELEGGGFHADGISEKMELVLEMIESKWISKLEYFYQEREKIADELIQTLVELDQIQ